MRSTFKYFGIMLALLLLVTGMSFAQTSKGTIAGVVTDATDAVVPSATVTATAVNGGETRSTTSSQNGSYRIEALNPGIYRVTVTAPNFTSVKIENVEVRGSATATANATLAIGSASEVVNVEATAGQELQTQSGEISHNISSREITTLPTLGLNPISLVLTQPGVVQPSGREDFTNGVGFSVNGTRPRSNNFLLDGQDNNDSSISGQAMQPQNAEAVQEVALLANSYAPEFGRGGGSVTNVITRSGTNQFHGSVWELHQNTSLQAMKQEDKIAGTEKAKSRQNTFGFAFGGPAVKDKLFFFGTTQWDRFRSTANGGTMRLPTEAGVTTLRSLGANANVDKLLAAMGSLRGQTNLSTIALGNSRPGVETGLVAREGVGQISNSTQLTTRVDWLPSSSDTFGFRYIFDDGVFTPDLFVNPNAMPGFDSEQGGRSQNMGITHTHTFSGNMVNEFRFSYGRINFGFNPTAETAANALFNQPAVSISGLGGVSIGFLTGLPQGRIQNTFQYQDALNYTVGNHTFKFGADVARLLIKSANPFNDRGTIGFSSGGGFTGLGNFVDDYLGAGAVARVFGDQTIRPNVLNQSYYVQDAWRLRTNFTLNYGVRYEFGGTPVNTLPYPALDLSNPFGTFPARVEQKADTNNWAPRVSFAYTPKILQGIFGDEKTVIRGGYGMFYDVFFHNMLSNVAASSPNVVGGTITSTGGRGQANAMALIGGVTPTLSARSAVTSVASNLVNPITHQWNFDVQRELPGNMITTVAYVGTRGVRLYANDQLNYGVDYARINPSRGSLVARTNSGDSIYHGLNAKVDRRFSNGLMFRAAYTWSKLIDTASEVFVTSGNSSYPQDPTNRAAERGLSAFHRAHRLALTYVYDIPSLPNSNNAFLKGTRFVLGDWQISGTTSFQTGAPETVSTGYDADGNLIGSDRPVLGNPNAELASFAYDGAQLGETPGVLYDGRAFDQEGVLKVVTADQVRWIIPGAGLGNVGRNTMISPGRQDWNFAVARRFRLPFEGSQEFQFRTEFFNPFNHANQGNVSYNLQDPDFGNAEITRFGGREIRFQVKYAF